MALFSLRALKAGTLHLMATGSASDLALAALNKGSAKTGSFLVRVLHGSIITWEYNSMYKGNKKKGSRFECYLVGDDPKQYCKGCAKGEKEANKAAAKFKDNTAWRFTRVALDGQADMRYMHTSMKHRIDLDNTSTEPLLEGTPEEKKSPRRCNPAPRLQA